MRGAYKILELRKELINSSTWLGIKTAQSRVGLKLYTLERQLVVTVVPHVAYQCSILNTIVTIIKIIRNLRSL